MPDFPLLPLPGYDRVQPPKSPGFSPPQIGKPSRARQGQRLDPKFDRLTNILRRDRDGLSLRHDPSSIAPERALVLEIAGSVRDFYALTLQLRGLEFLADHELTLQPDDDFFAIDSRKGREGERRTDKPIGGHIYLAMPDVQALRELLSLWKRWRNEESLGQGNAQWRDLFASLRDIRPWGPEDRITNDTINLLRKQVEFNSAAMLRIETELWYYESSSRRRTEYRRFEEAVSRSGGSIVDHAVIQAIRYEAALIDLPVSEIERLANRLESSLALCDSVMFIRSQSSIVVPNRTGEAELLSDDSAAPVNNSPPIAALLDGVPVQNHRLLSGRLDIDDPDNLEAMSVVTERFHGTSMASLIIHGDKNLRGQSLSRKLHVRPILYAPGNGEQEHPREDRLLVDAFHTAVRRMKEGERDSDPTAPDVFLVNVSIGDYHRPFSGPISPWARLLDYLARAVRDPFLGKRRERKTASTAERILGLDKLRGH